jgi:TonB-dependent starch-binding outer membrane protein SusC
VVLVEGIDRQRASRKARRRSIREPISLTLKEERMDLRQFRRALAVPLVLSLFAVPAWAQQGGRIVGRVVDARSGNGLAGTAVTLDSSRAGTFTSAQGAFEFENVPVGAHEVTVTGLGYGTQSRPVTVTAGQTVDIEFRLEERAITLDELVVTGYSVTPRRERTGALAQVTREAIEVMPITTVDQALQGRTAGVHLRMGSGQPGGAPVIRIRGVGSIDNVNTLPLFIVDGVQLAADRQQGGQASTSPLAALNPDDIESIEVLKDAAATSIYGAQAANGVVLITTRRGAAGETRFTFSSEMGIAESIETWDVVRGPEWVRLQMEAQGNRAVDTGASRESGEQAAIAAYGSPETVGHHDWQSAILRNGRTRKFNASVSGGGEDTRFFLSGGYEHQDAALINSEFDRVSLRTNIDHRPTERLSLLANLSLSSIAQFGELAGNNQNSPFWAAPHMRPIIPIYNEDGSYNTNIAPIPYNLLIQVNEEDRFAATRQAIGNVTANFSITPRLNFRSLWGLDFRARRESVYQPPEQQVIGDNGLETYRQVRNWTTNQVLDYRMSLAGGHSMSGLGGFEYRDEADEDFTAQGQGYPSGLFRKLGLAAVPADVDGEESGMKIASFFGRAQYDYLGRYLLSASIRRDGNSRFGSERRWGTFFSVSGGWDLSRESFLEGATLLDDLTLRLGYGTTGNSAIDDFQALTLFGAGQTYEGFAGLRPTNLGNDLLTWEKAKSINLGLTWALWGGRLSGAFDVFRTDNTDLLLEAFLPEDSGFDNVTRNVGTVRNQGIEVEIAGVPIQSDRFTWRTDFNIAYIDNEIIELYDGLESIDDDVRVGYPRLVHWGARWAGVNPADGRPMWYDADGNLTYRVTGEDEQVIGEEAPTYTGGLNNSFQYGPVRLDAFVQYVLGHKVQDTQLGSLLSIPTTRGLSTRVLERWQQPGDLTSVPKAYTNNSYPGTSSWTTFSTRSLYDGGFVRLKHVTLSIDLPDRLFTRAGLSGGRLYFQGLNLHTWTKFPGLDPEVQEAGNTWPQMRQFTAGIEVTR